MISNIPLAERLRPQKIDNYIGQKHLVGEGGVIRRMLDTGNLKSFILWGPPGVGKTTLARIVSKTLERPFYTLSAVSSGVKDVRQAIDSAKKQKFFNTPSPILFIDEIHRFSKSQQDSLLGAVEEGVVTLIGATTENPSFEVISPLLSRCQVYTLQHLDVEEMRQLVNLAISDTEYKDKEIKIEEDTAMFRYAGGDARKLYNILDLLIGAESGDKVVINDKTVQERLDDNIGVYDKNGELHYDIISAFIKSIRGSDPNAAVYWLARMIDGGEDVKFIARRLVISAAEDIGLANPNALLLANACFDSVKNIGHPEARIILSEATIYLASSPKSNAAYQAIDEALAFVKNSGNVDVPLHLRNAPTKLMKQLGYGKDYKYSHAYEGNFINQEYMPKEASGKRFYNPCKNKQEESIIQRLKNWWKGKYGY